MPAIARLLTVWICLLTLAAPLAHAQDGKAQTPDESSAEASQPDNAALETVEATVQSAVEGSALEGVVMREVVGLAIWQWIALFVLILIGFVLDLFVRGLLRRIWLVQARQRGGTADPETLKKTLKPFGLVAAAIIWLLAVKLVVPEGTPLLVLLVAARTILSIAGVLAAYRLADLLSEFFESRAVHTRTKIDDLLIPLVRKTVKIFITALGLVYIADALTVPILPLLSGLGIGGLAVAFAAKDTIENFFGSVAVIVDRPFDVGDWVVIGDVEGTVEELGFRSTRVRTFYNSLITIPNASLVRANVDNYGRRRYRRVKTHIAIAYDTPPDTIEAFCEGIREIVRLHPYTRKDYFQIWLHQFGAASLDILLYVFHEAPDWQTELRERQRLFLDIIRLAHRMGVEFAFPTQTLYVRNEEWSPQDLAAKSMNAPDTDERAQAEGRRIAAEITAKSSWREAKPPQYDFHVAPASVNVGRGSAGE